jgi:hypothetical protein
LPSEQRLHSEESARSFPTQQRHAEDLDAAGGMLDDEEDIQPAQGDRLNVEQVAGEDRVRLGAQKIRPRWSGSSG